MDTRTDQSGGNARGLEYAGHRWLETAVTPNVEPSVMSAFRVLWPAHYYQDPLDSHFFWILDYFFTPDAKFKAERKGATWQTRSPHVAHLVRPNAKCRHDLRHLDSVSHSCYISIRGGDLFGLDRLLPAGETHATFLDPANVLGDRLLAMTEVGEKYRYEGFIKVQALLYGVVDLLQRAKPLTLGTYQIESGESPSLSMVAAVRDYYEAHIMERITLTSVAAKLGMSVSVLAHRYKQETGETPMQTLTRLRIRKTKELLIAGRSVKEASEMTGFYDPFHLSKTFKRLERVSPKEFLKNLRNLQSPRSLA